MPAAPLRVAIVNESADPARGGAETSTREMAEALAACGASVTLVYAATTPRPGSVPDARTTGSSPDVRDNPLAVSGLGRAARTRAFLRAARSFVSESGFDVVHAVTPMAGASLYQPRGGTVAETIRRSEALAGRGLAGWLRRTARRFNARQRLVLREERALFASSNPPLIAPVSEYGALQIRRDYPHAAGRTNVVFNAIRVDSVPVVGDAARRANERKRLGLPPDERICAFCAHNFRLKGLRDLLSAIAILPPAERPLLAIVGRGDNGPYLQQAKRLGIASRVRFCGTAPAAAWTAAADLLAHPTWYDPCSRVVLEAAAAGLPVVTTAHDGAAELLPRAAAAGGGPTGFAIAEPSDAQALAAALRSASEPAVALAARRATTDLRAFCSMERHARELMSVYERARR
ncbi:MAG: glycosyltransferase family 4 protein [Phycisphaerales bacterium]|nr:glycosyltransferase family 4 protein [Phycisphaerales bacterium]